MFASPGPGGHGPNIRILPILFEVALFCLIGTGLVAHSDYFPLYAQPLFNPAPIRRRLRIVIHLEMRAVRPEVPGE